MIADVQDRKRNLEVMDKFRVLQQHVPLMELNPREGKNNISGTRNVAEAASHARVKGS